MNLNAGDNYYIENQVPQFFLIVALVGCTFSICVSFLLKKYDAFKFLRVIGYNSVHIYCLQIIVMSISRQVFSHLFHINNIPLLVLLTLMAGIFLPMVIYNLCLRVNLWWMFSLKKPIDELNFIKSKQ
jgi:fucose 4-O-acetylase-like acetyltransferase